MNLGKIILLNGASSSGKTSLIKALQLILDEPFLEAGLDKYIWMLPPRYLYRPLWDEVLGLAVEAGEIGNKLVSGMHQSLAALSRAGLNVLADHVLVEAAWVRECSELLDDLPAYLIGINCPLPVLEQREFERRDRTLGQARAQFERVHAHSLYDFEVDTSIAGVDCCAGQIAAFINAGIEPFAFRRLVRMIQP